MAFEEPSSIARVAAAWREAAIELNIVAFAPADVQDGGRALAFPCFLPHFGGPAGMIVGIYEPGRAASESHAWTFAKKAGLYCSLVEASGYSRFSRERFIEALSDWGYFGPAEQRPQWLRVAGA